jgi:hypothetical protein
MGFEETCGGATPVVHREKWGRYRELTTSLKDGYNKPNDAGG